MYTLPRSESVTQSRGKFGASSCFERMLVCSIKMTLQIPFLIPPPRPPQRQKRRSGFSLICWGSSDSKHCKYKLSDHHGTEKRSACNVRRSREAKLMSLHFYLLQFVPSFVPRPLWAPLCQKHCNGISIVGSVNLSPFFSFLHELWESSWETDCKKKKKKKESYWEDNEAWETLSELWILPRPEKKKKSLRRQRNTINGIRRKMFQWGVIRKWQQSRGSKLQFTSNRCRAFRDVEMAYLLSSPCWAVLLAL